MRRVIAWILAIWLIGIPALVFSYWFVDTALLSVRSHNVRWVQVQ